jgi:hypothetical protein
MSSIERKLPPNQTPIDRILRWFEELIVPKNKFVILL